MLCWGAAGGDEQAVRVLLRQRGSSWGWYMYVRIQAAEWQRCHKTPTCAHTQLCQAPDSTCNLQISFITIKNSCFIAQTASHSSGVSNKSVVCPLVSPSRNTYLSRPPDPPIIFQLRLPATQHNIDTSILGVFGSQLSRTASPRAPKTAAMGLNFLPAPHRLLIQSAKPQVQVHKPSASAPAASRGCGKARMGCVYIARQPGDWSLTDGSCLLQVCLWCFRAG